MSRLIPFAIVPVLALAATAWAAPVHGGDAVATTPDPYELATRWTLASLPAPASVLPLPVVSAAPAQMSRGLLMPPATVSGSPDPLTYALLGAALFGIGLLARRLGAGSKKPRKR